MINETAQNYLDTIEKNCKEINPLLAINCITYNHGKFLQKALDGFVMQKTDFPFVAIVHEDASTDNTTEILKQYAEKYPEIIFPIYETENQYSKRDGSLSEIMNKAMELTGAKYIAMCEGDDYWTDTLKLQKQVDFLESHPDYSMCFHNAIVHYQDSDKPDKYFNKNSYEGEFDKERILKGWNFVTASIVVRQEVMTHELFIKCGKSKNIMVGDVSLVLTCGYLGKIYYFKDAMSIYRNNSTNWTNTYIPERTYKFILQDIEYLKIFKDIYRADLQRELSNKIYEVINLIRKRKFQKALEVFFKILYYAPKQTLKKFFLN